jgi:hypothetical protein
MNNNRREFIKKSTAMAGLKNVNPCDYESISSVKDAWEKLD